MAKKVKEPTAKIIKEVVKEIIKKPVIGNKISCSVAEGKGVYFGCDKIKDGYKLSLPLSTYRELLALKYVNDI